MKTLCKFPQEFTDEDASLSFVNQNQFLGKVKGPCHLADLCVSLDADVAAGTYYVFVFDGMGTNLKTLKFPAVEVAQGQPMSWPPPLLPVPFPGGITVGISTTDSEFTNANVAFQFYKHVLYTERRGRL